MADLITLSELKAALGIDPTNTTNDTQYSTMIPWVTRVVTNYTERDFGAPTITEERPFEYDGSGFLDIDDASTVTAVKLTVPYGDDLVLDSVTEWRAMPPRRDDAEVYWYILMPGVVGEFGFTGEMGFTRNLDRLVAEGRWRSLPQTAKVTATWGWPTVPGDVKLAAAWIIEDWASKPSSEGLTAEAIEGWSRSWGGRTGGVQQALAIPNRARDILIQYQKQRV
jgi:hypothetical protein